jgi:hypothetical protein
MKIEKTEIYGFRAALRALRNPKDSWERSDSMYEKSYIHQMGEKNYNLEYLILGAADRKLSQQLTKAGSEHCKHLRLIQVWADLTLPRYIWQEFDTYRFVEKVSCSTMHKLMSYDLNSDMFEDGYNYISEEHIKTMQNCIDGHKLIGNEQMRKDFKLRLKRLLPESFLQKRTINTNYQQLLNIYKQRKNHELPEWKPICEWVINLPYFTELTGLEV